MKKNLKQQIYNLQEIDSLPQKIRNIWILNQRLSNQNQILKVQLAEKDRLIQRLKQQIDSAIMIETKTKLQYVRFIESQIIERTQEAKQSYLRSIAEFEKKQQSFENQKIKLQQRIKQVQKSNQYLKDKMKMILDYLTKALDEKDIIITTLIKMSHQQNRNEKQFRIQKETKNRNLTPKSSKVKKNY